MAEIASNLRLITTGKKPTSETLPRGHMGFGFVGSGVRVYANSSGEPVEITSKSYETIQKPVGTWLNGATLYQKTLECGLCPQVTEQGQPAYKEISTSLSASSKIIRVEGYAFKDGSVEFALPFVSGDDAMVFSSQFNLAPFNLRNIGSRARTCLIYTFPNGNASKVRLESNNNYFNSHTVVLIAEYTLS